MQQHFKSHIFLSPAVACVKSTLLSSWSLLLTTKCHSANAIQVFILRICHEKMPEHGTLLFEHGTVLHAGADCFRVVPPMKAKEAAKLMAWGLGPDWQGTNASALISNVVCGIRRGIAIAPTGNQTKVADYQMVLCHKALHNY